MNPASSAKPKPTFAIRFVITGLVHGGFISRTEAEMNGNMMRRRGAGPWEHVKMNVAKEDNSDGN